MKFIPILRIIVVTMIVSGFSMKARTQQLASQKPLSAVYTKNVQGWLAAKKENNPHPSSLQSQQNLPSARPLPRQATISKMKSPQVAHNAALTVNEKITKLPSKSALTVNQIAARKQAAKNPAPHLVAN